MIPIPLRNVSTEMPITAIPRPAKPVTPTALVEYAKTMFAAFPDYTLQIAAVSKVDDCKYLVEYHILGANTGPLPGHPTQQ